MRSVRGDLTAQATIRNAALALFAEHGPDAVSVRAIAAAANVSPALVLHHFGNKAGLREAVDAHAAAAFEAVFDVAGPDDVARILTEGDGASLAEAFARAFPTGSPLPAYLRRLMLSADPAGTRIFRRWYGATRILLDSLADAGFASRSEDPAVRSAFMLANDLALIVLRAPIENVLGFDPLAPDGLARWSKEVSVVYRDGVLTGREQPRAHDRDEPSRAKQEGE